MNKFLTLILISFFSTAVLAGSAPEFAKICMDCHGEKGVSLNSDVPTIAGAKVVFLEETLFAYKDGRRPIVKTKFRHGDVNRPITDMSEIAKNLSYDQITEVAAYYSEQKFIPAKQDFDSKLVSIGEKLHEKKCEKCHRDGGRAPVEESARLAGQWTPYLKETMKLLRDRKRDTDSEMEKAIDQLSEQEWLALMSYYASQQN